MSLNCMRILVIGKPLPGTGEILRRFTVAGWGSRLAANLHEARDVFDICEFDIVLANEALSDGRGYDFAESARRRAATLIVGVALTESSLWLPVIFRGVTVLGRRALSEEKLEQELRVLLAAPAPEPSRGSVREIFRKPPAVPASAPGPQRAGMIRRKYRDRDKAHMPSA